MKFDQPDCVPCKEDGPAWQEVVKGIESGRPRTLQSVFAAVVGEGGPQV
eukprot:SAG31_NODE_30084_length_385_cov_1.171329_2_plen_48_part_01